MSESTGRLHRELFGKSLERRKFESLLASLGRAGLLEERADAFEKDGKVKTLKADTVVIAAGSTPYTPLEEILKAEQIPYQVVGDANQVARAFDAVHAGYQAGTKV